jgi:hypothetical protein
MLVAPGRPRMDAGGFRHASPGVGVPAGPRRKRRGLLGCRGRAGVTLQQGGRSRVRVERARLSGPKADPVCFLVLVYPIHDISKRPTGKLKLQIGEKQTHRLRHISGRVIRTYVGIDYQVRAGPKL